LRRPILAKLAQGVDKQEFTSTFKLSAATYSRLRFHTDDEILRIPYKLNVTRASELRQRAIETLFEWLDREMPFQSGRNYRLQIGCLEAYYHR
jgi:hypothetical protein